MLKNDTLKNSTSRIGLYGSVPPPRGFDTTLLYLVDCDNHKGTELELGAAAFTQSLVNKL